MHNIFHVKKYHISSKKRIIFQNEANDTKGIFKFKVENKLTIPSYKKGKLQNDSSQNTT